MLLWLGFFLSAAVIVYAGTRLSRYGDVIAEKSGMGRTWIGVLLMASVTSLPELVTGISAVTYANVPDIAVGDILGSCVFNLLILGSLDVIERKKTLSVKTHHGHVISAGFGILLLALVSLSLNLGAGIAPFGWIGIYSILIIAIYLSAMKTVYAYEKRQIAQFIDKQAVEFKYEAVTMRSAVTSYCWNALAVIAAAVALPSIGGGLARTSGLGETFVGNTLVATATSLPEVVISLAAVRMGAIDLAIGNLLGSNIFNVLILAVDDLFFTAGPILSFAGGNQIISAIAAISMSAIMIIGLTYRSEKKRLFPAWDTIGVVLIYISNLMLLYMYK